VIFLLQNYAKKLKRGTEYVPPAPTGEAVRDGFPAELQAPRLHWCAAAGLPRATKPVAVWPLGYEFGNIPLTFFCLCRWRNLALELVD